MEDRLVLNRNLKLGCGGCPMELWMVFVHINGRLILSKNAKKTGVTNYLRKKFGEWYGT